MKVRAARKVDCGDHEDAAGSTIDADPGTPLLWALRSRRGDKGRDDRKFLEAMHYFTVHNVTWRAPPAEFGPWNSVWKRC